MFIVCTGREADKKSLKKITKIVISSVYEDMDTDDRTTILNQFLPSRKLFYQFQNGDISQKKYMSKYQKNIKENDELSATITLLMMVYAREKDVCLVCSEDEMRFGYMNAFAHILQDDFGATVMSYKKWKENGKKFGKAPYDKSFLKEMVSRYKDILEEDDDYKPSKKKKKKDKKKKKNKSNIWETEIKKPKKKNKDVWNKSKKKQKVNLDEFIKDEPKSKRSKGQEGLIKDGFLISDTHIIRINRLNK